MKLLIVSYGVDIKSITENLDFPYETDIEKAKLDTKTNYIAYHIGPDVYTAVDSSISNTVISHIYEATDKYILEDIKRDIALYKKLNSIIDLLVNKDLLDYEYKGGVVTICVSGYVFTQEELVLKAMKDDLYLGFIMRLYLTIN